MTRFFTRFRAWLSTPAGRIVSRDVVVSAAAGTAVWQASGEHATWGVIAAIGMAVFKALLRKLIPDLPQILGFDAAGITTTTHGGTVTISQKLWRGDLGAVATGLRVISTPERRKRGKRLGRHIEHDERSRAYAVTARDVTTLRSVRHRRHTGIFDQGNIGSCTGNAMAGALCTAPFRHRFTESRALKLYELATELDGFPGVYPPDDTGSSGLAVAKAAQRQGYISSYLHCFTLEAVLTALQDGPVLLGVNWHEGFDNPASDGRMAFAGGIRGGHEICADEIDVERQRVWITNSWGASWGVNGRAYWTWADLRAVLADSGDAVVPKPKA